MTVIQGICIIIYVGIGFVQMAALFAGLETWWGLPWILSGPISLFVGQLPILGSVVGAFGAVQAWGWSWTWAIALFAWAHRSNDLGGPGRWRRSSVPPPHHVLSLSTLPARRCSSV